MAFDLNSKPQDLRPINVIRNVADDTRMAPVITSGRPIEGFYANPTRDLGGNHNPLPVYYPSTVPDTGFVPIGFNNVVPNGWVRHVVPSQFQPGISPTVLNSGVGYTNSPMFGARSDHASEDGGDESVSGRKVKFLCSFGGTIMPRPSDSALRYAGGQTRIISVRRDISFSELVQKMMEIYAQDVVIKYQLPDEELDALVSVSCPEDLENMMDEYEKFVERSVDGSSAKLRIFLFSSSDLESPLHDGGYRYLEAINGFVDDFGGSGGEGGGRIARKESIESSAAGASQASDFSGMDGGDGLSHVHGEVTSLPSPVCFSPNIPSETAPRMMYMDQNPVLYTDSSGALSSVPMVQPAPTTVLGSEQAVDRPVGSTAQQQQPGVSFPVSSPYVQVQQTYQDPRQETFNRGTFVQLPAQMGFPGQMFGPAGPMFSQVGHMAMNQPSFVNMRPGPIGGPAIVQPQQVHLDNFPAGSMVSQRVVPFSTDQGYGAPKVQISAAIQQGGVYGWHQIPHPEVARSEGLNPQPILTPDKVPRLEDCFMCQKQLPHAHSDTVAKELKESPFFDSRSIYQSLHLDNRGRPVVTGTSNDDNIESGKIQTEGQRMNDKTVLQKVEVPEHSLVTHPHGVAVTSGIPSPYGVFVAKSPQPYQANAAYHVVGQPQFQVVHDNTAVERPSINDFVPVHESPRDYYGNVSDGSPKDDSTSLAYDHLRQIDGRLENLHIRPSEILANNEQTIARKIDALEIRSPPQVAIRDIPNMHNVLPVDSYEVVEPPLMHGVNHLVANDNTVHPVYPGNCQDNILRSQPLVSGDKGKNVTSISPSYGVGDVQDNSASLFSNQDPWNLQNDTQCPPPRPSKLQMRKESTVPRDPLGESRLMNRSESPIGNGRDSPLGEGAHEFSGNLNRDLSSNKGSAEELIKQELQAVAEGVAASVLQSSGPSNPDLLAHGTSDSSLTTQQNKEVYRDKLEEVKTKLPEKANLGFPASDGIGRLQIIRNSDLEELRELGSGTFGTVYHGKWRGTDVAIKRINDRCFAAKPSEQERMRDDFWNEAVKLADLHHPNVVAFYGVVLDGPDGSVATVTEYMVNGSLRNALQKNERNLDKRKRLLIGMDVAFGMEYLHGKNIVHFDLKSDNLLVNLRDPHRPICKVGDLGLSKVKCQTLISGGVRGTLPWMAPELLNGSSSLVSEKVDVFSFGIVMWELLTGEEPYADLHYGAIIGGIVSNTLRPPVPETCDPMWRALMERCWAPEPKERPNFTEIANELRAMAAKLPAKA